MVSTILRTTTLVLLCALVFLDISPLLQWPPALPQAMQVEASILPAIKIESFDQDVTADGSTFALSDDVGDTSAAFIRINSGTRKSSAGPIGSTANTGPNIGTVGLVLTDTDEVTVKRVNPTAVKVMGEVWRYEGPAGGAHEFVVRDRVAISLAGDIASQAISGISDVDKVIPFITGYTVDDSSVNSWENAVIAAHMNDVGDVIVSRNNSGVVATVYVDIVEFTGSAWNVCHGYSNNHDAAPETVTLNTDSDGLGGGVCDIGDWGTASIIEATMEGDTDETGISDTLALVRPGSNTTSVIFDLHQDAAARNDGEAWIHVLQNDDMVVTRASSADISEGDGTYGTVSWPIGATTIAALDTLSLEWFADTSGVGTAHMRGGLHARITDPPTTVYGDGDLVPSGDYDATIEGNFESELTFAATPLGVIYEAGGTGTGSFVGYNDAGDFIIRAGNGGSTEPADAARIVITASDYDFSGRTGTLSWNFYPDTESVDLSFDEGSNGSIDYSTSTTAAAAWANWSGGDDGYVGNANTSIAGSEITSGFDFNGTIAEVRFSQGGSQNITHWIHRTGNTVGVEYGIIELAGLTFDNTFFGFDTLVTATSTHITAANIPSSDVYVGGAFVIREGTSARNVTNITITESGTIDGATGLSDIELWYDVSTIAPYDCREHSYDGNEMQFGSTDANGFSGANGVSSFTSSVPINTSRSLCVYPVMTITESATDGETIAISINNTTTDVTATGGGLVGSPSQPQAITGSVVVQNAELTQVHYHWREDDGSESGATSVDGLEDTPAGGFQAGIQRRLRIGVSAEGSADASAAQFRLQYAEKAGTCAMATGWEDVADIGGAWDIGDSANLSFGDNATNIISPALGAISDEETHFNGVQTIVDGGDKSVSVQIDADEFAELEYTVITTSAAVEGATYCFRLVDETPNVTHDYRIPILVQSSQVNSDLINFPVYVDLNTLGSHFFANVKSDGSDIRVTTADGTEVAREIASIDTGVKTGELHFQAPSVSSSADTTFYIYYGSADENEYQASSTYGSRAVWNSNYEAVYHYDDTPSGSGSIFDSTANANHGDAQGGMSGSSLAAGRMSHGYNFSGGNYYINFPQLVGGNSQMTVSYWINNPSYNDGRAFSSSGNGTSQVLVWPDDIGGLECIVDGARAGNTANPTGWVHHACTYNGTTVQNYANSTPAGSASKTGNIATIGTGDRFGADGGLAAYLNDTVDELRVMNTAVSADWLEAEYTNQINPTTFYATSTFQALSRSPVLVSYNVYPEANITADITVGSSGNQIANLNAGAADQYVGGVFEVVRDGTSRTLTSITVTETASVDATLLTNPRLYYDLAADCSLESYAPTDSFIAGTAFSGANGTSTFNGSVSIDSSQSFCGYVVFDISAAVTNGETINIEIQNPSTDVVVVGSSVGPSSSISPTGETLVFGSILTQVHYHWRNDDGAEDEATSATGGIEDVPLIDVPQESPRRLRIGVSNEGLVTSQSTQYRLEYATKVTTCDMAYTWIDVDELGGAWDMVASPNIADGDTTNIPTSTLGAITDENTTFQGGGALRESTSQSGFISLASDEFTELEYSIEATQNAGYATEYCFRVTADGIALGAYNSYPELTTREKQDYFVQRGTLFVAGAGETLVAGVDYVAPAATSTAFVRITNSHYTGAGVSYDADANFNPDDVTAYISDQEDITTSFTISRPPAAVDSTRVSWEIVEYIGLPGADNEMIVRDVGAATYAPSGDVATGSAVTSIANDDDVVVFITGQYNPAANTNDWMEGLSTSEWSQSTNEPVFRRGQTNSIAAAVSYAVVEFAGQNWNVQRVEHLYSGAAGSVETESIAPVNSLQRTFLHAQKRVAGTATGLDDYGHQVWLSSIGAISFQLNSGADVPAQNTSVAWVIENTQSGNGAAMVYRASGFVDSNEVVEPRISSVPFGGTVNQISNASLFINNDSTGPGIAYPRTILGAVIASTTHFELFEADAGQTQAYRVEVVAWPVADVAIRQNYYRFYVDNGALNPSDPWPVGPANLGENTSITASDDPLGEGERVRLRMTLAISNATLPAGVSVFKLQYGLRTTSCGAIGSWVDVGSPGSGAIWRGYDNVPVDGLELATSTPAAGLLNISVSDVAGTYEENNPSVINPYLVAVGEDVEYDWLIEHNGAAQRSDYCFRMVFNDDTELAGYNNYPTLRTTGYTPVISQWRWYTDETNLTPTLSLAAENVAPIDVINQDVIKLRVTAAEVENAAGLNVKFALQYSEYADFSDGGTYLTSVSTCTENSLWCYADSAGVDNVIISTTTLSDAGVCVQGAGVGCGTHNETATTTSTLYHAANENLELEFSLRHAGARANAVYYFRLVDTNFDEPLVASSTYPSLVTEGPGLTATLSSVPSGVSVAGIVSDVETTATSINFGSIPVGTSYEAVHRLTVSTNATQGYRMLMYATSQLTNSYGEIIPAITATNDAPAGWSTACTAAATGCFGYHTTDAVLQGGSSRFAPIDSYAAVSTTPQEIMYSSIPTVDVHDIVYRIQVTEGQPAGDYTANIVYVSVPVF